MLLRNQCFGPWRRRLSGFAAGARADLFTSRPSSSGLWQCSDSKMCKPRVAPGGPRLNQHQSELLGRLYAMGSEMLGLWTVLGRFVVGGCPYKVADPRSGKPAIAVLRLVYR